MIEAKRAPPQEPSSSRPPAAASRPSSPTRGRFETAAVLPPARLRIYHGEHAVGHQLEACQPPLRIGVRFAPSSH